MRLANEAFLQEEIKVCTMTDEITNSFTEHCRDDMGHVCIGARHLDSLVIRGAIAYLTSTCVVIKVDAGVRISRGVDVQRQTLDVITKTNVAGVPTRRQGHATRVMSAAVRDLIPNCAPTGQVFADGRINNQHVVGLLTKVCEKLKLTVMFTPTNAVRKDRFEICWPEHVPPQQVLAGGATLRYTNTHTHTHTPEAPKHMALALHACTCQVALALARTGHCMLLIGTCRRRYVGPWSST